MRKVLFSILALSLLLAPAVAAQGRGGTADHKGRMIERIADRLDLSKVETELFVQTLETQHESMAPAMDELGNLRQALSDQITADVFDEAAIRDHASQLAELEADLAVARAQHAQEIRGMLTDEQWTQFKKIRQHRERSAMGMGQRRGPGDHPGGQQHGR